MAVISALVSLSSSPTATIADCPDSKHTHDAIRSFYTDKHAFSFLVTPHLYYLCVSSTGEPESCIQLQLELFHTAVLAHITQAQLDKIFTLQKNYDLRKLLSGTEKFMDAIPTFYGSNPGPSTNSIPFLRTPITIQSKIHKVLSQIPIPQHTASILLLSSSLKLVHAHHHPSLSTLSPSDLHILFLLLQTNTFHGEAWVPLCLPNQDANNFVHIYIKTLSSIPYQNPDSPSSRASTPLPGMMTTPWNILHAGAKSCPSTMLTRPPLASTITLVVISTSHSQFHAISNYKLILEGCLRDARILNALDGAMRLDPTQLDEIHVRELSAAIVHFKYDIKGKRSNGGGVDGSRYTMPAISELYGNDKVRLVRLFQKMRTRIDQFIETSQLNLPMAKSSTSLPLSSPSSTAALVSSPAFSLRKSTSPITLTHQSYYKLPHNSTSLAPQNRNMIETSIYTRITHSRPRQFAQHGKGEMVEEVFCVFLTPKTDVIDSNTDQVDFSERMKSVRDWVWERRGELVGL